MKKTDSKNNNDCIIATANPKVSIRIEVRFKTTGEKLFVGTAIESDTLNPIERICQSTISYSRNKLACFNSIEQDILDQYERLYHVEKVSELEVIDSSQIDAQYLINLLEEGIANGKIKPSQFKWCERTFNASVRDFKREFVRRVLKQLHLDIFEQLEFSKDLIDEWFKDSVSKSKRSNAYQYFSGETSELGYVNDSRNNLICRINRCYLIYDAIRKIYPSLPELYFNGNLYKEDAIKCELQKSIPSAIKRKLIKQLLALASEKPIEVFGSCLLLMSCRIAEACGTKPEDVKDYVNYITVNILRQEKDGKIIKQLKTLYSKRIIVGVKVFRDIIQICIPLINEMHIPSNKPLIVQKDLCEFFKSQLIEAGIEQALLDDFASDYKNVFNEDDGPFGIASHIARRDFVNICMNYCGFKYSDCMTMIGHKTKGKKMERLNMADTETQKRVAKQLENYVYDIDHSLNSFYNETELIPGFDFDINNTRGSSLINCCDDPIVVKISVSTDEINDGIELFTNVPEKNIHIQFCRIDSKIETRSRNVICGGLFHEDDSFNEKSREKKDSRKENRKKRSYAGNHSVDRL